MFKLLILKLYSLHTQKHIIVRNHMSKKIIFSALICASFLCQAYNEYSVQKKLNFCVQELCKVLPKQAKILELAPLYEFFSLSSSADIQARCTILTQVADNPMMQSIKATHLQGVGSKYQNKNITFLLDDIDPKTLATMQKLEKFDAVLAFSIVHQLQEKYDISATKAVELILSLAPIAVIGILQDDSPYSIALMQELEKLGGKEMEALYENNIAYKIFLFNRRKAKAKNSRLKNLKHKTYKLFHGCYCNMVLS